MAPLCPKNSLRTLIFSQRTTVPRVLWDEAVSLLYFLPLLPEGDMTREKGSRDLLPHRPPAPKLAWGPQLASWGSYCVICMKGGTEGGDVTTPFMISALLPGKKKPWIWGWCEGRDTPQPPLLSFPLLSALPPLLLITRCNGVMGDP